VFVLAGEENDKMLNDVADKTASTLSVPKTKVIDVVMVKTNPISTKINEPWSGYSMTISFCRTDSHIDDTVPYNIGTAVRLIDDTLDGIPLFEDYAVIYQDKLNINYKIHIFMKNKLKSEPSKTIWCEWAKILRDKIKVMDDDYWFSGIVGVNPADDVVSQAHVVLDDWQNRLVSRHDSNSMMFPPVKLFKADYGLPLHALEHTASKTDRSLLLEAFKMAMIEKTDSKVDEADVSELTLLKKRNAEYMNTINRLTQELKSFKN
jgi:hypothetical protein